jgi:hypothetical protein
MKITRKSKFLYLEVHFFDHFFDTLRKKDNNISNYLKISRMALDFSGYREKPTPDLGCDTVRFAYDTT